MRNRFYVLICMLFCFSSTTPAFAVYPFSNTSSASFFPSYNPKGVILNMDTMLGATNGPLGVTNTQQHTLSFWMNTTRNLGSISNGATVVTGVSDSASIAGNTPGLYLAFDSSIGMQFNFNNSVGVSGTTDTIKFTGTAGPSSLTPFAGTWHHYLISFDDTINSAWAVYIDGVKWAFNSIFDPNIYPDFNNLNGWRFGNGTNKGVAFGWYAEIYESNWSVVCTAVGAPYSDCTGVGTISPSMIKKFYNNGYPVNMGTHCEVPTGTSPQICLIGDGTEMASNKGTATNPIRALTFKPPGGGSQAANGSFAAGATSITMSGTPPHNIVSGWTVSDLTLHTIIGTVQSYTGTALVLQGAGATTASSGAADQISFSGPQTVPLEPAPYGPAGLMDHRATMRWGAYNQSGATASITASNAGYPIVPGDMLVLVGTFSNTSTAGGPPVPTCPSGWTESGKASNTSVYAFSTIVCYQLQTTALAVGGAIPTTTITGSTAATRVSSWYLADYTATNGINQANPIDVSACQANAFSSSPATPVLTTTYPTDTLVSVVVEFNAAHDWVLAPASSNYRFYVNQAQGNNAFIGVADEHLTATGPASRLWTLSAGDYSITCTLAINNN